MENFSFGLIPIYKKNDWSLELLLINQKDKWKWFWWFPKWHLENGEKPIDAAIRETQEETWLKNLTILDDMEQKIEYEFLFEWKRIKKLVVYRVAFTKDQNVKIQNSEISEYKRLSFEQTLDLATYENTKNMIKKIMDKL